MRGLTYYRLKAGLSQSELAEKIGTHQPLISQWENGLEMGVDVMNKLHKVLSEEGVIPPGVPPTALGEPATVEAE